MAKLNYVRNNLAEVARIQLCVPYKHYSIKSLNALKHNYMIEDAKCAQHTSFAYGLYLQYREKMESPAFRLDNMTINCVNGYIVLCAYTASKASLISKAVRLFSSMLNKKSVYYKRNIVSLGQKYKPKEFVECHNHMIANWNPIITINSRFNPKPAKITALKAYANKLVKPAKLAGGESVSCVKEEITLVPLKCKNLAYAAILLKYFNGHAYVDDDIYVSTGLDLKKLKGTPSILNFVKKFKSIKKEHFTHYLQYESMAVLPINQINKITATSNEQLVKELQKCL